MQITKSGSMVLKWKLKPLDNCFGTDDFDEGTSAFLEKEKSDF